MGSDKLAGDLADGTGRLTRLNGAICGIVRSAISSGASDRTADARRQRARTRGDRSDPTD